MEVEEEEEEEDMLQHTLAPTSLSLLPEKLTSGYDMKRLLKDSGTDVDMDQEPPAYRQMPSGSRNLRSLLHSPGLLLDSVAQLQSVSHSSKQLQPQYSCSSSYGRLRRSNSAPIIGDQSRRRRLSLQSLQSYRNEENGGRLRRISSEIYVDRGTFVVLIFFIDCFTPYLYVGPDIDSPDRVRAALGMPSWARAVQKDTPAQDTAATPATEIVLESKQQGYVYPSTEGHTHLRKGSEEDTLPHSHCTGGTEVERHVTLQGKTFETYKTVC